MKKPVLRRVMHGFVAGCSGGDTLGFAARLRYSEFMPAKQPDFLSKPMSDMTADEWESLCDGCGLCCQLRLQDEDSGEIVLSNIACQLLDLNTHRCTDYSNRQRRVPDCVKVTPENVHGLDWLPVSCGYRMVARGEKLASWHPLISGNPDSVHRRGPSMRGELVSETEVDMDDL